MERVNVTIEGVSPLIMHRFPLIAIEGYDKLTPGRQAELAAYKTAEGTLYIPGVNVQRALVAGAAFSKGKGRSTLGKVAAACLMVTPEVLELLPQEYIVDSRAVVISATRGRIVRHRPRFNQWQIAFALEWDETLMTRVQVRRIVDDTGQRVGLLDFRPEKKGPFGRFSVTHWTDD